MPNLDRSLVVSRGLAVVALTLWLLSLTQTAFTIDNAGREPSLWSGANTLMLGWFTLSPAWFANFPFLFSTFILIISKKAPIVTILFGIVMTVDTFRIETLPGGGRADVVGYGPGAAIWFAAFGILLLAATRRRAELQNATSAYATLRTPAFFFALLLVSGATIIYGVYAYQATQTTSLTESKYLPTGAVKRGKVCTESVQPPLSQLELNGPLEIIGWSSGLGSPRDLLRWGIPVVRRNGFDFTLHNSNDMRTLYWTPARGPASATLHLVSHKNNNLDVVLKSGDGMKTAFAQTWSRNVLRNTLYCPDHRPRDATSPTRMQLSAALGIPDGFQPPGIIADGKRLSVTRHSKETRQRAKQLRVVTDDIVEPPRAVDCAPRAMFLDSDPARFSTGDTFVVDDRYYRATNNKPLAAVCRDNSVYFYYFWHSHNTQADLLYIQRSKVSNLQKVWSTVIDVGELHGDSLDERKQVIRILSLQEQGGTVTARVVNAERSLSVDFSFGVPLDEVP